MDGFDGNTVLVGDLLRRRRLTADGLAIDDFRANAARHVKLPIRRTSLGHQVLVLEQFNHDLSSWRTNERDCILPMPTHLRPGEAPKDGMRVIILSAAPHDRANLGKKRWPRQLNEG